MYLLTKHYYLSNNYSNNQCSTCEVYYRKILSKFFIILIISLAADLIVFYTLFVILFYIDIRNQHTNTNKNKEYTIKDIKKLITTLGIAEMVIF